MTEKKAHTVNSEAPDLQKSPSRVSSGTGVVPKKQTYAKSLSLYSGTYSKDNLLKLLIAPFVTLLNIAALYTIVTSGMLQTWYVGTAIVQAQLFSAPPYNLNAAQLGYLAVGPLLGGALGSLFIAVTSDPVAKWATLRNKGV